MVLALAPSEQLHNRQRTKAPWFTNCFNKGGHHRPAQNRQCRDAVQNRARGVSPETASLSDPLLDARSLQATDPRGACEIGGGF